MGAEQEDVARRGLRRPVLVDRADEGLLGLQHHPEIAQFGDRTAGGDGGETGPLAATELGIHRVVVDPGGTSTAARHDALADQCEHLVETLSWQVAVVMGSPHELEQVVGPPLCGRGLGHHLLGQYVERSIRGFDRIQATGPHRGQQRRRLHELVPGEWEEAPRGCALPRVVGPAHPLEERGDRPWGADLAHQLHRPDVDAQLQRCGCHQGTQVAGTQARLHALAPLAAQRSVVRSHDVVAQPLAQLVREAFGHAAGVDEHQRGAATLHQLGDAVEHPLHL